VIEMTPRAWRGHRVGQRLTSETCGRSGQPETENNLRASGTPFSSCSPRSSKAIPEPATRSLTVEETSTSPAPATCGALTWDNESGATRSGHVKKEFVVQPVRPQRSRSGRKPRTRGE